MWLEVFPHQPAVACLKTWGILSDGIRRESKNTTQEIRLLLSLNKEQTEADVRGFTATSSKLFSYRIKNIVIKNFEFKTSVCVENYVFWQMELCVCTVNWDPTNTWHCATETTFSLYVIVNHLIAQVVHFSTYLRYLLLLQFFLFILSSTFTTLIPKLGRLCKIYIKTEQSDSQILWIILFTAEHRKH